jgi:hypothetical protein
VALAFDVEGTREGRKINEGEGWGGSEKEVKFDNDCASLQITTILPMI